jgi:penicillin-binding protein 2
MQQEADRARAFTRRAVVLGGAQVGLFAALVARLYGLQVLKAGEYALLADDNRINQRLLIPPRGRILDRRGRPLAQNMPTYRVRVVREQAGDIRATVARLAKVVAIEPKRIDEVADQAHFLRPFVPITVREDLSWEEVSLIAVNAPDLPGVLLDSSLLRDYRFCCKACRPAGIG